MTLKIKCSYVAEGEPFTLGRTYTIYCESATTGLYYIKDDSERYLEGILARLNNGSTGVQFEIIDEEEEMQYTEKDLKEGTKLRCTHSKPAHWTVGKVYEVSSDNIGELSITDNDGSPAFKNYMLDCLNGNHNPVSFEIVNEEETMQEFKIGDLVEITSNTSNARNEKDELYNVGEKVIITDVYSTTVRIGNHKWTNLITKDELKKVEPTATITVDIEKQLNDRIELLHKERMNIIDKIERMEGQRVKLRDKIQKLNEAKEALEILKEFK
ncbi:cytidine deaminase [Enterococcus phage vB_EfaS_AL2]|uniref:Cytidine deaminase n=1 Tax=Enterococcus phage vB_EfaS_AL2 TaxID=2175688 RepID=A0A2S1PFB2_9CAUD|nr:cytidine deaminase [Enterococcus phage vB_EfaS_AL2]AWH15245.1 cytidine deaminase [Enterococcus phage vB_EfaS_AL2]